MFNFGRNNQNNPSNKKHSSSPNKQAVCSFGSKCHYKDTTCNRFHPTKPCKFGAGCNKDTCTFDHAHVRRTSPARAVTTLPSASRAPVGSLALQQMTGGRPMHMQTVLATAGTSSGAVFQDDVRTMTRTTVHDVPGQIVKKAVPLDATILLDVSPSMSMSIDGILRPISPDFILPGSPLETAVKELTTLMRDVLNAKDKVTMYTFSGTVRKLFVTIKRNSIDAAHLAKEVAKNTVARPYGTALYDSIGQAIKDLRDRKTAGTVHEVFALTDGEDNRSTEFTLESVKAMIREPRVPNFNLIILGINLDARGLAAVTELCAGIKHATLLTCVGDPIEMKNLIHRVSAKMKMHRQTVIETLTVRKTKTTFARREK